MALETLKEIEKIGIFEITHRNSNDTNQDPPEIEEYHEIEKEKVLIDHKRNIILFKIQNGPVKEKGVNGCQVDTMIEAAKLIIEGLNNNFPCRENSIVITKLDEALMWLNKRKQDREKRNVEGFNKI